MRWFHAYEDQASFTFHFIKSYISEKAFLDSSAADYSGEIFTVKMTKIQRSEFEANFYEIALTVTLRIQSVTVRTVTYHVSVSQNQYLWWARLGPTGPARIEGKLFRSVTVKTETQKFCSNIVIARLKFLYPGNYFFMFRVWSISVI